MENTSYINEVPEIESNDKKFFKDVVVEKTLIWNRPEQNIIYLMSEFIDNSKASYEEMLSLSIEKDLPEKLPIEVIFNQKLGYISFKDYARGFDIQKSIERIGRNEVNVGSTNQYFIGMKSAMNYFGNFSILISERLVNGENKRFVNYFIFEKGLHPQYDLELEGTNQTGSEIYLFANYNCAKNFWLTLNFKNKNDKYIFEYLNLNDITNYSVTGEVLANLKNLFPILTWSLFERYSFLVGKYSKIEILFTYLDREGVNLNNSKSLEIPENAKAYPKYYTKISKNDWEADRSFSFERLLTLSDENDVKSFKNNINSYDFRKQLEKLLFNDIRQHFQKAKIEGNREEYKREKVGKVIPYEIEWIDYFPKEPSYDFIENDLWSEYPFAKCLASIFMNGLLSGTGSFSHIKFRVKNLTLTPQLEIISSNNYKDKIFDLVFDLNVLSKRYINKTDYPWGPILSDNMAGLSLIQNNRAIYHGPNFDPLTSKDYIRWSREWPSRFLANDFRRGDSSAFPNFYTDKKYPTHVEIAGNTSRWSSKIFGSIVLPNGDIFNTGTNKTQIGNIKSLEDFTFDVLRDSAINVFARWIHLFDQKAVVGNPKQKQIEAYKRSNVKDRKGIILIDILNSLYRNEQDKIGALNPETNAIDTEKLKEKIGSGEYKKIASAILEDFHSNGLKIQEGLELESKDKQSIIKYSLNFLRTSKNNDWSVLNIKKIELSEINNEMIIVNLDKIFNRWQRTMSIKFDFQPNDKIWNYVLEDGEPIQITIPLDISNINISIIKDLVNKWLRKLYFHLCMVTGFYRVATKKKISSPLNLNLIEDTIENYLANAFDNFAIMEI